jgi:outer membrane protein assembly factor BamB
LSGTESSDSNAPVSFVVTAFDRATGRQLWEYVRAAEGDLQVVHEKHNLSTPSPVTDGERVYAWFGTGQILALDMSGKLVWELTRSRTTSQSRRADASTSSSGSV